MALQVRTAKKAEVQSQKRAEKAAKEAAAREADMRSYSHILKVGAVVLGHCRNETSACARMIGHTAGTASQMGAGAHLCLSLLCRRRTW